MPIVFVHGVNNREGASYEAGIKVRNQFLTEYFSGVSIEGKQLGSPPNIPNPPYWGDLGASFKWKMSSLPKGRLQALGGAGSTENAELIALIKDGLPNPIGNEPLTELARHNFQAAVDVVIELAISNADNNDVDKTASFVVALSKYAEENPNPDWLNNVNDDQELINQIQHHVSQGQAGVQQLGGGLLGRLKMGAVKLKQSVTGMANSAINKAGDFASTKALARSREPLNRTLGQFFGDIFIYFNSRKDKDNPGEIPARIIKSLEDAKTSVPDEPLMVIGHSLGGVITYDVLSHFKPELEVDLFVSVGSQVAHFEEMKLYHESDPDLGPPDKVPKPSNIKHWINVYDEVDIFAYDVSDVFSNVDFDLHYDTGTYVIKAHGAYFEQAKFYERLKARVEQL